MPPIPDDMTREIATAIKARVAAFPEYADHFAKAVETDALAMAEAAEAHLAEFPVFSAHLRDCIRSIRIFIAHQPTGPKPAANVAGMTNPETPVAPAINPETPVAPTFTPAPPDPAPAPKVLPITK